MPVRAFSEADILVSERRRLERPLVFLLAISLASFTLAIGNWFYLIAACVVCGIRLSLVSNNKEFCVRRRWINAAVILASALTVFELLGQSHYPIETLGKFIVLIIMCKLFERSVNRDYVWLLVLSMLLMIATALINASIPVAVALTAYLIAGCYTTAVLTLKTGLDRMVSTHLSVEDAPMSPHVVAWNVRRKWPERPIRRQLAPLIIVMAITGLVAFLGTPRSAFLGRQGSRRASMPGSITLGKAKTVRLSDEVAMKVRLDMDGKTMAPAGDLGYFRMSVFTRYSRSQWSGGPDDFLTAFSPAGPPSEKGLVRQQVQIAPWLLNDTIFRTLATVSPVAHVRMNSGGDVEMDGGGLVRITERQLPDDWIKYTVWSRHRQGGAGGKVSSRRAKSMMEMLRSGEMSLAGVAAVFALGEPVPGATTAPEGGSVYMPRRIFDGYANGKWLSVAEFEDKVISVPRGRWWRRGRPSRHGRYFRSSLLEILREASLPGPDYARPWREIPRTWCENTQEPRALPCDIPPALERLARIYCADLLAFHGVEAPLAIPDVLARRLASSVARQTRYAMEFPGVDPLVDPVEDFLLNHKAGCSEHSASAVALMGKSLGISVRVVGGLRVRHRREDAVTMLRDSHALAWTEVQTPDGWELIDFSPSRFFQGDTVEVSPLVAELARDWCRDLLMLRSSAPPQLRGQYNLRLAYRLATLLQDKYDYSLDLTSANSSRDGVEDFLFFMKKGHCEYFASALAVMCRALDVPSRVVGGFRVDPIEKEDDWYVVRRRDAHAWVEVFSPDDGWVIVDATPAGVDPRDGGWRSRLAGLWEDMHTTWYGKVMSYDDEARRIVSETCGKAVKAAGAWAMGVLRSVWVGLVALIASGEVDEAVLRLMVALAVVGGGLEILVLLRLYHRVQHRQLYLRRVMGSRWKQAKFILRFLKLLEGKGLDMSQHQTLGRIASHAADDLGLPNDEIQRVVRFYHRLRWGQHVPTAQELRDIEAVVDGLRTHTSS